MVKTWFSMKAGENGAPARVEIYDEIGAWGVSAKAFNEEILALDAEGGKIEIHLNTPGGEVFDGLAIANQIENLKAETVGIIDGLAASMGSVIFLACDQRVMPENAFLMIHNPSSMAWGEAKDLRKMADTLDTIRAQMIAFYVKRTGQTEEEVARMMDETTWMAGLDAVALGFADTISDPVNAKACIKAEMAARMGEIPEAAKAFIFAMEQNQNETEEEGSVETPSEEEIAADADAATPSASPAEPSAEASLDVSPSVEVEASADDEMTEEEKTEIRAVCALLNAKDRADEFIAARASVETVRAALWDAKVAMEEKQDTSTIVVGVKAARKGGLVEARRAELNRVRGRTSS